jgi:GNAT superfamily N-acetyltransferase
LEGLEATRWRREEVRRAWFADAACPVHTFVAELSGRVVGFADVTPSSDEDAAPRTGYLGAIYLVADAAGKGIGRLLQEAALKDLCVRGFTEATLWVLSTNN